MRKIVRFFMLIIITLDVLVVIFTAPKYYNGEYVETEATITYVNQYWGRVGGTKLHRKVQRANGHIEYIYNGEKHNPNKYIDFDKDAQVGDKIKIVVDGENGSYLACQTVWGLIFGSIFIVSPLCCVVWWTYQEPKKSARKF